MIGIVVHTAYKFNNNIYIISATELKRSRARGGEGERKLMRNVIMY